jgi:hypothetical protein
MNICKRLLSIRILLPLLTAASIPPLVQAQTLKGFSAFHINSQRLQGTLEKLSEFGRNPDGGVTRLGFSETDLAAREYVDEASGA